VLLKHFKRLGCQFLGLAPVGQCEFLEEMISQQRNVFDALAQRRH